MEVSKEAVKRKPIILYIFTDDQSHRTASCYPEAYPWVRTPNIDQLAKQVAIRSIGYIFYFGN